jgi:polysaccharide biosynthesis/export protein
MRFLMLFAFLILTGCGVSGTRPLAELAPAATDEPYRVRNGDVLSVKVWGEPSLTGDVVVREDGKFSMNLINEVDAAGKYLADVQSDISNRLGKFVPGASVVVSLSQMAPVRFYLGGSFQKPGQYRQDGKVTLLQAIAMGGGFAPFADYSSILLIRRIGQEERRYSLSWDRILAGKEPNPELMDGDTVQIK